MQYMEDDCNGFQTVTILLALLVPDGKTKCQLITYDFHLSKHNSACSTLWYHHIDILPTWISFRYKYVTHSMFCLTCLAGIQIGYTFYCTNYVVSHNLYCVVIVNTCQATTTSKCRHSKCFMLKGLWDVSVNLLMHTNPYPMQSSLA